MSEHTFDVEAIARVFDFNVTSGGNFKLSEVLSLVFDAKQQADFIDVLVPNFPDIFGQISLEVEPGEGVVPAITPVGLLKLIFILPTPPGIGEEEADFIQSVRENMAIGALSTAVNIRDEQAEAEEAEPPVDDANMGMLFADGEVACANTASFGLDGDEDEETEAPEPELEYDVTPGITFSFDENGNLQQIVCDL